MAAVGHGIAGVDRQVENDHFGLGRVCQRLPQGWFQVQAHRDIAAQGAAQQFFQAGQGAVEVQRHRLQPLASGESQQLRGQLGTALAGFANVREPRTGFFQVGFGQVALEEAGAGEDYRQQVVEIVRHTGGQLTDRFQPLHLLQRGLDTFAFGDLLAQAGVGFGQAKGGLAFAGDVARHHVKQGVFRHHHPGQPALLATGIQDTPDKAGAGAAVGEGGQFGEQQFLVGLG